MATASLFKPCDKVKLTPRKREALSGKIGTIDHLVEGLWESTTGNVLYRIDFGTGVLLSAWHHELQPVEEGK